MNYLYHNICIRISIGSNLQFNVCNSIEINKSVHNLTSTAIVQLPREFKNALDSSGKVVDLQGRSILDFIKKGDPIKIEFGYDQDYQVEFEGYIIKIGADIPLALECEDEMYQLKKADRITKMIDSTKLEDILTAIIPSGYTIELDADYQIGKWLINSNTPYQVLEELREKIPILKAYFKTKNILMVGSTVDLKPTTVHKFNFSRNVRNSSDLKFNQLADSPKYITIESKQSNGQTLSYSLGEKTGDTKTVKLTPNLTMADLEKYAKMYLKHEKTNRLEGTLESWCYPRTQPGDVAQIARPYYLDKHQDGKYFIEDVNITVNATDGIKRANKLGYRL